jgi:hypothetical protein
MKCKFCEKDHAVELCPRVASVEYFESGKLKKVTLHDPKAIRIPQLQPIVIREQPYVPVFVTPQHPVDPAPWRPNRFEPWVMCRPTTGGYVPQRLRSHSHD